MSSLRDDLARAIKKLKVLGGGFAVLLIGGKRLVQCVPGELSMDHTTVIQKAEVGWVGGEWERRDVKGWAVEMQSGRRD